jgi:hypothetical protein
MRSTIQAGKITCQGTRKEAEISLTGDASKPKYQNGKLWNKRTEPLVLTLLLVQACVIVLEWMLIRT